VKVCTYDNPSTMARECWQGGKLLCHYSASLFLMRKKIPAEHFFFGANIGPWKTGQLVGDSDAMSET
jgi:hypothetical protein